MKAYTDLQTRALAALHSHLNCSTLRETSMKEYNEIRLAIACDALRSAINAQVNPTENEKRIAPKGKTLYTLTVSGAACELENLRKLDNGRY